MTDHALGGALMSDPTKSLFAAREGIAQARRELWWFIERYTDEDDDTVARAISIQDDLLRPAIEAIDKAQTLVAAVEAEFCSPTAANQDATREALERVRGRPIGGLPAPGMTDLMVSPESIDRYLAEHPPPEGE